MDFNIPISIIFKNLIDLYRGFQCLYPCLYRICVSLHQTFLSLPISLLNQWFSPADIGVPTYISVESVDLSSGHRPPTYISVKSVDLSSRFQLLVPLFYISDELEPALSQLCLHLLQQTISPPLYNDLKIKNGID